MSEDLVEQIVAEALGAGAGIQERTPLNFQSNQLFDVWHNGRIPVNIQLRRYLARAKCWPAKPTAADLALLAKLNFIPD